MSRYSLATNRLRGAITVRLYTDHNLLRLIEPVIRRTTTSTQHFGIDRIEEEVPIGYAVPSEIDMEVAVLLIAIADESMTDRTTSTSIVDGAPLVELCCDDVHPILYRIVHTTEYANTFLILKVLLQSLSRKLSVCATTLRAILHS